MRISGTPCLILFSCIMIAAQKSSTEKNNPVAVLILVFLSQLPGLGLAGLDERKQQQIEHLRTKTAPEWQAQPSRMHQSNWG